MEPDAQPSPESGGVEIDAEQLSPGALRGLVEEYVSREGTDYGQGGGGNVATGTRDVHHEWSLEEKVTQVLRQIDSGEAHIVFDLELESASIVSAQEFARRQSTSTDSD